MHEGIRKGFIGVILERCDSTDTIRFLGVINMEENVYTQGGSPNL